MIKVIKLFIVTLAFYANGLTQTLFVMQHGSHNSTSDYIVKFYCDKVDYIPATRFSSYFSLYDENEIVVFVDQFYRYSLKTNEYSPYCQIPEKYDVISYCLNSGKLFLSLSEDEYDRFNNDDLFIWDGERLEKGTFPKHLNLNHISVSPGGGKIAFQHSVIVEEKINNYLMVYDFGSKSITEIDSNFSGDNYCYSYDNNPFVQWLNEDKLLFIEYTEESPMGIISEYNIQINEKRKLFESKQKKIYSFQYVNGVIYALTIENEIVRIKCGNLDVVYASTHYPLRCLRLLGK